MNGINKGARRTLQVVLECTVACAACYLTRGSMAIKLILNEFLSFWCLQTFYGPVEALFPSERLATLFSANRFIFFILLTFHFIFQKSTVGSLEVYT